MVQNTDLTFFTNEPERDLYSRFSKILKSNTQFFDVLVGYFRTSGFFKMYDAMETVEKIRILVGLNVDKYTVKIIDKANAEIKYEAPTMKEAKESFSENVENEFAQSDTTSQIEQGVRTFIEWLKNGKLEMRMYVDAPIHAKVYIMRKDMNKIPDTYGSVITGSSNFSEAGLQNNLEFNVELKDSRDVQFALEKFEELWVQGVPVTEEYIEAVEKKTWLRNDITPYEIYLKTLYEFFREEINSDKDLLADNLLPDGYMKLQYQIDAVVQAKKILEAYNGVFISDVVGLGKTYICAMLAKSLKKGRKLVICPPVLVDYWKDVLLEFDVAAEVKSLGKLESILEKGVDKYKYVFIDEAHRFRNQGTESFSKLHKICYGKKVVLISATPINNYSSDIENQIYLFQPKHNSTIIGVKNLEGFFRELRTKEKKYTKGTQMYLDQLRENSEEIRDKILRHIMIRRTRGEIKEYYAEDLKRQGLSFPKLGTPEPIVYTFDDDTNMVFNETVDVIKNFKYSRYKPLVYLKDTKKYASLLTSQHNMGGFMKSILVKRLESSFYAFKNTLQRFQDSYEKFIAMYDSGEVYISKKIDVYDLLDNGDDDKLMDLVEAETVMHFKSTDFNEKFIKDLKWDLTKLKYLSSMWANKFELNYYKQCDIYKPAKGGMINIFRLFICKSYDVLRKDGHLSLIFPMAFMCDLSSAKLREFVLKENKIDYLEAFPERDNENKRVFKSAKMSVCILGSTKTHVKEDVLFPMRISDDRFVDVNSAKTMMSRKDIESIDGKSFTIPIMKPEEYKILLKICEGSTRMAQYSKCYTGEIDLSLNKKYIHFEDTYSRMLRGAQVQKFYTTDNISQGDILFLDSELYLHENSTPRSKHHNEQRIVMQGITGVNERYRLKMTLSNAGEYCANSVNYLMCGQDNFYFLGLLNSHLLNWYFAKLSTNSNVNGYEVDNIPIKIDETKKKYISELVERLLENPTDYESEDELNTLIYDMYGLSKDERKIVERRYL